MADISDNPDIGSNDNYDPSKDPTRKAKSNDPGWKYDFWPKIGEKDLIECALCHKQMHSGVKRLKQHLTGGYGDVEKCKKTTPEIRNEIVAFVQQKASKNKANVTFNDDDDDDVEVASVQRQPSSHESAIHPSSGTATKRKQSLLKFGESQRVGKESKSVVSMLRKNPEVVVEERHAKGASQSTLEVWTKTKEEKKRIHLHIAKFFYDCGIPFNAANSRSFEVMIESVGQGGPGLIPPSYHELRVPLLQEVVQETHKLKDNHLIAWKKYGCTLMSDGWTDRRGRHLINFLVNSPAGTFFLESVDASNKSHDASMLADLLESKINEIGKEFVSQVVTDNGANYKAAGRLLEQRIPTFFWTPCAAHCLDLMLEDIGKLSEFKPNIESARRVTTFIYRHGRILSQFREQSGRADLVRPGVTRFATAFLTLQSLNKHKDALRRLLSSTEWSTSKLAKTEAAKKVTETVLSTPFWTTVVHSLQVAYPLLVVLRLVDGDEKPAMPEVTVAMDHAKGKINQALASKARLLTKVMDIIEDRWRDQMGVELYGAALFLNPSKYFELKKKDFGYAAKQRYMFNTVLLKMISDEGLVHKISQQVDDYDDMRGSFGMKLAVMQQQTKNPLDWWNAFGCLHLELWSFACRIISLCCSSSSCERNWSTFEFMHTKRRNRLEHKRLNDLVFIQYNGKIANRFKKRQEGGDFNPLVLEEMPWDNEWVVGDDDVVHPGDDLTWQQVDEAIGASDNLRGRNVPRRGSGQTNEASGSVLSYSRRRSSTSTSTLTLVDEDEESEDLEPFPTDDMDVTDDDENDPTPNDESHDAHVDEFDFES